MRNRILLAVSVSVVVMAFVAQGGTGVTKTGHQTNRALAATLKGNPMGLPQKVSGGVEASYREAMAVTKGVRAASVPAIAPDTNGCSNTFAGFGGVPDNVRANQDCSNRRQAEVQVMQNPTDSDNLYFGQNESQHGFNQTGADYSIDGGLHWGYAPPGTRYLNCAGAGFDAFSDPAGTFDGDGNFYYSAVGFNLNSATTAIAVWKSNADHKASFLHNPNGNELSANPVTVHTNCGEENLSDDKQLMTADTNASSPFFNNVYLTWTIFDFHCGDSGGDYCSSDIYESHSTDQGVTWTDPQIISGTNSDICKFGDLFDPARAAGDCDFDQGSAPIVGPDGTVYVAFNNCNVSLKGALGLPGKCQQLMVKSTDGGVTWGDPVRVGIDQATEPLNFPSNPTMNSVGCPFGRQCLYPNGYRMNDFPSIGIDDNTGKLAVYWSDFRHGGPCAQATLGSLSYNTEPCDNHNEDVLAAWSDDGGASWHHPPTVTRVGGGRRAPSDPAAQWQPWGDVAEDGTLVVAYYDRSDVYGSCEADGCNDITLAQSNNNGGTWSYRRITTSSMPNLTPANNAVQQGFLGDYMWTEVDGTTVRIAWSDTRGVVGSANPVPEEDGYYAWVALH